MKKDDFPADFFEQFRRFPRGEDPSVDPEIRVQEALTNRFLALLPEDYEIGFDDLVALRRADKALRAALAHFLSYAERRAGETEFRTQLARCCNATPLVNFLKLMAFCGSDQSLMDHFMELGTHPKGVLILAYVRWLFTAREAVLLGKGVDDYREIFGHEIKGFKLDAAAAPVLEKMDKRVFDSVTRKEILNYVVEAMDSPVDTRYGPDFRWPIADAPLRAVEERFALPLLVWGGLFREATALGAEFSSHDLEALLVDTQIRGFKGRPDFDLSTSKEFSKADYEKFSTMVRAAISPPLSDSLIEDFPGELQDPDYHFLVVRVDGELMGVIKWNDEGYVGSQYVDPRYAQRFAMGVYLQNRALASLPEGVTPRYTVYVHNTALERQIDRYGIATGITVRPSVRGPGGEEFVAEAGGEGYRSKDFKIFTREMIQSLALGQTVPGVDTEGLSIFRIDSSPENHEAYLAEMQRHFEVDEVLTRVFYARNGEEPDPRQTFMVFEKKITSTSDS